jgi:hypothetical protein
MKILWIGCKLLIFFLLAGMSHPLALYAESVVIVYSGNTLGELKPCGCAKEEDQGGIERRMSFLKNLLVKEKNILLVDTGDNFKEPSRQGKIKAEFLAKSMAKMQYDAITLGDHDLVYGNEFLNKLQSLPWVVSNLKSATLELPRVRIKQLANGLKVAVLAVVDPALFYSLEHAGMQVLDPQKTLEPLLRQLERDESPDLVVLLTHMSRKRSLALLKLEGVDVIINGHIENENSLIDMNPVEQNGKIFVQPGPKGQKLGELRVQVFPGKSPAYKYKMVRLDSSIKDDPEMIKLYESYNQEIEELFFATRTARRSKNKHQVYATEIQCKTCHPAKHQVWSQSRHGRAYSTLAKINKAFDPECLACHVTGWNLAGGFVSEVDTPELQNVQCEVCHGPGLKHMQAPTAGFGKNAKSACAQCHVKSHSPNFNFDKYWPKIRH